MTQEPIHNEHALVVLSGGQDSVTCLGYALRRFTKVSAISFHYQQRHVAELACAKLLCGSYLVEQRLVDLEGTLATLVTSALIGNVDDVAKPHPKKPGLPASFVPGRNALFLVLAHAHAQEIGASVIITGVCQTDYSGYPDCRGAFITALEQALNLGYQTDISISTPLMNRTKAETFALAAKDGFLHEVLENSHTCYRGNHTDRHPWGYGCNNCPACELRRKGYEEFINHKSDNLIET